VNSLSRGDIASGLIRQNLDFRLEYLHQDESPRAREFTEVFHRQIPSNNFCLLESSESAVFLDGAHTTGGDGDVDGFFEFRNVDLLSLKIWIAADRTTGVELGGAGAVGISSTDY